MAVLALSLSSPAHASLLKVATLPHRLSGRVSRHLVAREHSALRLRRLSLK